MRLIFHLQNGKVKTFNIPKDSVSVGREEECDVVLPYAGFSRKHAEVELINDEVYVTDFGSTNGVFIDGERIAPYERKLAPSYLSLQIGPTTQVEISGDPVAEEITELKIPEITRSHSNIQLSSDVTRTTRLNPALIKELNKSKNQKKAPEPKNKNKNKSKNINQNSIVIVLILILAGATHFYFNQEAELPVDTDLVKAETVVETPISQTDFLMKPVLVSSYKNASCSDQLAQWCEQGRLLSSNKEGVVIEGRALVVYLNMDAYINETYSEAFNQLDLSRRLEILALKRVLSSQLLGSLIRQKNLDTVQVVVGTIKEDQYSPMMAFKFKRDLAAEKIEKFYVLRLFDEALNGGTLDSLIDISMIYDKLTF